MNNDSENYTCPMHPDIKSNVPGKCPKCGMNLVKNTSAKPNQSTGKDSYTPLLVVIGLIGLVTGVVGLNEFNQGLFNLNNLFVNFMAGFFLVFSGLKLLDLKGFVEGYATYDLLAKRAPQYGYIYPFIELGLGLAYLTRFHFDLTNWVTVIIMLFSSLGVIIELSKGNKIRCYCLGTVLKVPLTYVTVIEDLGMAAMAAAMLFLIN